MEERSRHCTLNGFGWLSVGEPGTPNDVSGRGTAAALEGLTCSRGRISRCAKHRRENGCTHNAISPVIALPGQRAEVAEGRAVRLEFGTGRVVRARLVVGLRGESLTVMLM